MSAVNGIVSTDVDHDGNKDIILAGNFYPFRVSIGPLDAGMGLVLKGNGKGVFTAMPYAQTGLYLAGDIRNLVKIKSGNTYFIAAANNNGPLQIVKLNNDK